jgi:hypothetical protein
MVLTEVMELQELQELQVQLELQAQQELMGQTVHLILTQITQAKSHQQPMVQQ